VSCVARRKFELLPSPNDCFADQQIGTLLYRDIQYAFFDFLGDVMTSCNENPAVGRIPITWEKPIYGDTIPNFTDFAAPGVQLT
jgi:hypothetical protein